MRAALLQHNGCSEKPLKAVLSGCQTLAAFGTTTLDDEATIFGCHTCTETVVALTLEYAGLECSFHGFRPSLLNQYFLTQHTFWYIRLVHQASDTNLKPGLC